METKEIYEKYIEEFTDEVKDYVKGTKGTDGNKYHDWQTMLEIAEQFRVDMLAVIQSQDFKLGENQAPKKVQQVDVIATGNLGDVSGYPDNILLEKLSDLEHQQWMHLIEYIKGLKDDDLNYFITCGWNNKLIPYNQLIEEDKEKDRIWARKIVEVIAQEILKHKDCKVMHNLGKHGKGEMTCLDKVLESLGYTNELNTTRRFFSSQP